MACSKDIDDYYLWENLTKTCDGEQPAFYSPTIAEFAALLEFPPAALAAPTRAAAPTAPAEPVSQTSHAKCLAKPHAKPVPRNITSAATAMPVSLPTQSYSNKLLGRAKTTPQTFDEKTYGRLRKQKIKIERKLDLHGAQQDHAHSLLLNFLAQASKDKLRYVIIITGKGGIAEQGILRQIVPKWLCWGAHAIYVSAFAQASAKHGANGALYVRLRNNALV